MSKREKTPGNILAASIIGILLSFGGLCASGLEALLVLTIIPLLLCLGLLIKKNWICGLMYCIYYCTL